MYSKRLPAMRDITKLSTLVRTYPVSRREAVRIARIWNMPEEVVAFLREFAAEKQFMTRTDFVSACEDMAVRIRQDWESPIQKSLNL